MKSLIPWFVVVTALFSVACQLSGTLTDNAITPAPSELPATETPPPIPTILPATDTPTALPPTPIVYYYFVDIENESPPAGRVVILPDILILAPALSGETSSSDIAANIGSALQAMLADPRNAWTSADVGITSLTFDAGTANVVLEGEYFAPGDVVLIAAREQILLTVFAEASVQTATITLNGNNIANLGSSQGEPVDHTYTRLEIETFMAENAYQMAGQETTQILDLEGIWQNNGFMAAGWANRYHFYPSGTFHFYPNEMICSVEKIEKIGTWKYEDSILTLMTTKQVVKSYEISTGGLCHAVGKKEVTLAEPAIEQFTIIDHGMVEGDIYPSISIEDQQFWKFSDDASSYGDEKFPEQ